jgi:hypothetical protein
MQFRFSIKGQISERQTSPCYIMLLGMCCLWATMSAQDIAPGGVEAPAIWAAARIDSRHIELANPNSHTFIYRTANKESAEINYNPAIVLNDRMDGLHIEMDNDLAASSTYFIIFIPDNNSTEYALWTLAAQDSTLLVMTNHRVADMSASRYFNYQQNGDPQARLYNYVRSGTELGLQQQLKFFKSDNPDIPLSPFKGKIAEIIVYDRTLAQGEKARVQSYLAIKYGISLSQYAAPLYFNSSGRIIWNGVANTEYVQDVTGIGRDDKSGLRQIKSTSAAHPEMLSIGINPDVSSSGLIDSVMAEDAFCIWSHNGSPNKLNESPSVGINSIQRQWQVEINHPSSFQNTEVIIDPDHFDFGDNYEAIWLKIVNDPKSSGQSELPRYIRGVKENGNLVFHKVAWDEDNSGSDNFTFSPAPKVFPAISVVSPSCEAQSTGKLHLAIYGGSTPYSITLSNQNSGEQTIWTENGNDASVRDIAAGQYKLQIEDAAGDMYFEVIDVSHEDGPEICLDKLYKIKQAEHVLIDASSDCGTYGSIYNWTTPDGSRISQPAIQASANGDYQIEVQKNGCVAYERISVIMSDVNLFTEVTMSPNPIGPEQSLTLRALLTTPAKIEIQIRTVNGSLISSRNIGESELFVTQFNAPTSPGIYFVTLSSVTDVVTLKLIVQ